MEETPKKDNTGLCVVGVAMLLKDKVYTLPPPIRHADLMLAMAIDMQQWPKGAEAGFVLNSGLFATRERAAQIALAAGQCVKPLCYDNTKLHSEDLWCDLEEKSCPDDRLLFFSNIL